MLHEFQVSVDYRQFYLWDPTVTTQAPEEFSAEDVEHRVKVAASVVVVQPERDGDVSVSLAVLASDPGCDSSACDHAVECSVDLPGGRLQVHECLGGSVLDLDVDPGTYGVRVAFYGLRSIDPDGLGGQDRYVLQLWPADPRSLVVTKQWSDAG